MTKTELLAQLKNYRDDADLVVAYWDAEWFKEYVADGDELSDEELFVCMSCAEEVLENMGLGEQIVSFARAELARHRDEKANA